MASPSNESHSIGSWGCAAAGRSEWGLQGWEHLEPETRRCPFGGVSMAHTPVSCWGLLFHSFFQEGGRQTRTSMQLHVEAAAS